MMVQSKVRSVLWWKHMYVYIWKHGLTPTWIFFKFEGEKRKMKVSKEIKLISIQGPFPHQQSQLEWCIKTLGNFWKTLGKATAQWLASYCSPWSTGLGLCNPWHLYIGAIHHLLLWIQPSAQCIGDHVHISLCPGFGQWHVLEGLQLLAQVQVLPAHG